LQLSSPIQITFFAPIIAETFGGWTDSSVTLIDEIGTYYAARQKISIPKEPIHPRSDIFHIIRTILG
jgi:hypothetical protein